MKLFLIDDDHNILNIMRLIIRDRNLGTLCGTASNPLDALEDITQLQPDIIVVDLLMPEMDGISFVKKARPLLPSTAFIMLSQVSSKEMIASAYESGIEYFIQKPINSVEVENILHKVEEKLNTQRTLQKVQSIFSGPVTDSNITAEAKQEEPYLIELKNILQKIGIISDKGSKDIINVVTYLIENQVSLDDCTLTDICGTFSDTPKSVEQRIRRAASNGLVNVANLGLEDYANDTFIEYSNTLYNFEQIRKEMDLIRKKSERGGNVKIKNFLNALVLASTKND